MRLDRVVFVPATPLLVTDVASGAAAELDDVRAAVRQELAEVTESPVAVIGAASQTSVYPAEARSSFRGFGLKEAARSANDVRPALPATLSVGAWLCHCSSITPVGFVGVDSAAGGTEIDEAVELFQSHEASVLLVVGDGSARRSPAAPGAFDERAAAFDAVIDRCVTEVDVKGLLQLDHGLCDELLVAGRAAWQVAACAVNDPDAWNGRVRMFDPYGVAYFVGSWTRGNE